jgi:hypothetical protein
MAAIQVSVFNQYAKLQDSDIIKAVAALKTQLQRDFAPVWGVDASVEFFPADQVPAGTWQIGIFDDTDQAGALGYHDLTQDGLPFGKVFAGTDEQYQSSWTVTLSHEFLEMLIDPDINLTSSAPFERTMRFYAYEVCDACEADQYGYKIDEVLVSDFVYPAWFEYFRETGSTKFDYQQRINAPFQLLPGGYIGTLDLDAGIGWSQVTAEGSRATINMRGPVGSRRERRTVNKNLWLRSKSRLSL